jgi:hypothetical protein
MEAWEIGNSDGVLAAGSELGFSRHSFFTLGLQRAPSHHASDFAGGRAHPDFSAKDCS